MSTKYHCKKRINNVELTPILFHLKMNDTEQCLEILDSYITNADSKSTDYMLSLLKQCEELYKRNQIEVHAYGSNDSTKLWTQQTQNRINSIKRSLLLSHNNHNNSDCFSPTEMRLSAQNETLNKVCVDLHQSELTGRDILQGLNEQRDTISNVKNKTETIQSDMGYANKLLNSMKNWWQIGSINKK